MSALYGFFALLFLAASFFFSGFETGMYSLNRIRMRIRAEAGDPRAIRVRAFADDMPGILATLLVGNNLVIDCLAFMAILMLTEWGVPDPQYLSTLIVTPVNFLFGEVLPKHLFSQRPNALVYPSSLFASAARILFFPLVYTLRRFAILASGGRGRHGDELAFTRAKLGFVLDQGVREGVVSPQLQGLAGNIMRMGGIRLRQVMVPIGKAAVIAEGDGIEALAEIARKTDRSRFPVIGADGRAKGIIHVFDLATRMQDDRRTIADLMQQPVEFHEDFPLDDALFILQKRKRQMAVVVGKDGKATGIVTIKDLVEEIVGEISAW